MNSFTKWDRCASVLSFRRYQSSLAGTEAVYDEWIPSNGVFEKCVASAICSSVWRRSFRTHPDTNPTFYASHEVEGLQTRSLYSIDSRPSLKEDTIHEPWMSPW
ncbi:hypothetical protein TNCV_2582311 [Trichonephila clavipes]|nr:hypothetical protein TNCV_2582311 [Trichonephila clavipes]